MKINFPSSKYFYLFCNKKISTSQLILKGEKIIHSFPELLKFKIDPLKINDLSFTWFCKETMIYLFNSLLHFLQIFFSMNCLIKSSSPLKKKSGTFKNVTFSTKSHIYVHLLFLFPFFIFFNSIAMMMLIPKS